MTSKNLMRRRTKSIEQLKKNFIFRLRNISRKIIPFSNTRQATNSKSVTKRLLKLSIRQSLYTVRMYISSPQKLIRERMMDITKMKIVKQKSILMKSLVTMLKLMMIGSISKRIRVLSSILKS